MRSLLALGLVWFWSLRLTWSYFRREKWRVGWREDWRFANYRESMGWFWLPASFFVAFVSQHLMLLGLTLPFYAAHQSTEALGVWDAITCVLCVSGVVIAWNADDQLFAFMTGNAYRRQQGRPTELILEQGLWRYCRHPNHLGEQTWSVTNSTRVRPSSPCSIESTCSHLCLVDLTGG